MSELTEQVEPSPPPAPAANSPCATAPDGVVTIERPMFPDNENSQTFGYSFKVFPGTDPNAPTVIYLPGGPGQAGIGTSREGAVPPGEYTLIETDPRGVGCNAAETPDHYPDAFYNTVYIADDVLAIVETLRLDSYVLYGISYGTALATVVASRAQQRGLSAPRALVLEGVLGRAFAAAEPEQGFFEQWMAIYIHLPVDIQKQFQVTPLPFGFSALEWGSILENALPSAAVPATGEQYSQLEVVLRAGLAADADQATRDAVESGLAELAHNPTDDFVERIHHAIACHELTETDPTAMVLGPDGLVVVSQDCQDVLLDRPYAASDWPVAAPIYYYTGTNDPNTPPWQADVHFSVETSAARSLVHVTRAGHNALRSNLTDCMPTLWAAMVSDGDFEAALATCTWPTELLRSL